MTRHLKWRAGLKGTLDTTRASVDKMVVGVVSPTVETTRMGMTMIEGTNDQVIGTAEVVRLLVIGMAHSWEEEVDHPRDRLVHQEVPPPTRVPIRAIPPITLARLTAGTITTIIMGNTPITSGDIPQETIDTSS